MSVCLFIIENSNFLALNGNPLQVIPNVHILSKCFCISQEITDFYLKDVSLRLKTCHY